MTDVVTQDVNVFDPNFQVPYADTYTIGVQRGLTRTMAFEIRYVGTRSREQVATYNLNEINIIENGFLDEFKLAQANLLAHVSAGCGTTGPAGVLVRVPRRRHRHVTAADLPRVPQRLGRSEQRGGLCRRQLDQRDVHQPARAQQPQPVHRGQHVGRRRGTARSRAGGRAAGEPARRQPGLPGRGQHHRQRRVYRLQRPAVGTAPPPLGWPPVPVELRLRDHAELGALLVPGAPPGSPAGGWRGRSDPRPQAQLGVRAAVRPGQALGEPGERRDGPHHRRMADPRQHACPERPPRGLRQRPDGRVRREGTARGSLQTPHRQQPPRVDAAANGG